MDKIFAHKPTLGVNTVFESAKESASHERLLKTLYHIFSNASQSIFILEFLQCLAVVVTYMDKQPQVENTLDFAAKYCIYHGSRVGEEDNMLLLAVFEFIFDNHHRQLTAIRYRTCEFVNRLLNKMGPQAVLDDDIFEKMASTMLERLQDKMPTIRAQAVMAVQRLQDPPNKNCKIIKAFSYHIEADPSSDVRARIVQHIAIIQRTLPLILGRLQDLKETVRKEAYKALNRLKPQKITIRQRQSILSSGFADRSDLVKSYVKDHLIPSWFHHCNSNLIDFLTILDVVSFKAETLKSVLAHLYTLKEIPRAELIAVVERLESDSAGRRVIPKSDLNPETVTLWASVVQFLGFDACDSVILPELTHFAKYLSMYSSELNLKDRDDQYILKQLIEIAKCYSFADEMGRKQLIETCTDILKIDGIGIEVVPPIVNLLELLVPNSKERMVLMAELISDIREPLETDEQSMQEINWESKGSPKKNEKDLDISVESISEGISQLHCESDVLAECPRTERTDPETLIKCLTIVKEMLKSPSIVEFDATLFTLKEHFIGKCFNSTDGRVLSLAADALGLICIWNLDLAKEYFLKFCILIADDAASVSALEAVFDILLFHGFEPFSFGCFSDSSSSSELGDVLGEGSALDYSTDHTLTPTMKKIVPLLASLLKSHIREVKCKASEGLSKLLLSSRIDSPIVLAHLIILWFSPSTDKEPLIRQPLGMFFSLFSSRRVGAPEVILSAFVPTMRGVEELHDENINTGQIANLFVTLLRSDISSKIGKQKGEKGSYHGQLALIILEEIRQEVIPLQTLTKALSSLQLDESDGVLADNLSIQALRTYKWLSRRSADRRVLAIINRLKEDAESVKEKYEEKKNNPEPSDFRADENALKESNILNDLSKENNKRKSGLSSKRESGTTRRQRKGKKSFKDEKDTTINSSQDGTLSEATLGSKSELGVIDESTSFESDENISQKRVLSINAETETSISPENQIAPSPPKQRMLRSRNK